MDWSHLFMPSDDHEGNGVGSLDADHSLLFPNSDFFENLPRSTTTLPQRPPSVPLDLEPAPLFSPQLGASDTQPPLLETRVQQSQGLSYLQVAPASNSLGLQHIDSLGHPAPGLRQHHPQSHSSASHLAQPSRQADTLGIAQQIRPPEVDQPPVPQPALNALFDSNEESYLNSFLSSFDVEGFDLGPYLASPLPMANFSSRTDLGTMGMGMGIGAGMMSAMDDVIPHLSLDENSQDVAAATAAARRLTRMSQTPVASGVPGQTHTASIGGMMPMRRPSFFDYGLGGTSHLSLGNVMTEEMHKVSSWLLQNQGHQVGSPANTAGAFFPGAANGSSTNAANIPGPDRRRAPSQPQMAYANNAGIPAQQQMGSGIGGFAGPPSESDFSIKRKASQEQLDQPRKSRGSVWSPMREMPPALSGPSMSGDGVATMQNVASAFAFADSAQREPGSANSKARIISNSKENDEASAGEDAGVGSGSKRREDKKGSQRMVLTEDERRANHIASEQRRRNQIRQGYAELMSLVTTLRDPALGNHPGTAQSTPSKAVILSHAVQFIRGLEEGNRLLRKRIEGTPRHMHQSLNPHQRQHHLAMQQAQAHMQPQTHSHSQPQAQSQAQTMASLNVCSPGSPSTQQQH
ncbi:hypothetical protein IWW45_007738 [Coemansia sp. RSA 485]|nr:hypothetical protein IWW45_007738 [Coemansia sp. RSA 485]